MASTDWSRSFARSSPPIKWFRHSYDQDPRPIVLPPETNFILRLILNRSLSLEEKSQCPDQAENAFPDDSEVRRLLALWEKIATQGHPEPGRFEAHLKTLGMSREQAVDRLKGRTLPDHVSWPPWAKLLQEVLLDDRGPEENLAVAESPSPDLAASPGPKAGPGATTPIFPEFLGRFVRIILARVRRQVGDDDQFMSASVVRDLAGYFLQRLSAQAARTVAYDVKNRAARHELRGETPTQRYQYWVSEVLGCSEGLGRWLLTYPVLGRLLGTVSLNLIEAAVLVLRRLKRDHLELSRCFGQNGKLGGLTGLTAGLSDPHLHGQTVCRLTFESGVRVIYKPRSLAVDAIHNRLMGWWNQQQPDLPLRPVKLLQRRVYGWCECLSQSECQSAEEVSRYYQRQGVHLALFYLLGGTDFHHENFIPCGEWPIPIDLEGLLALGIFDPYPPAGPAPPCLQPLSTSVTSTLMLPAWRGGNQDQPLGFTSGINGGGDRVSPVPEPGWIHLGTDQLQLIREFRVRDTTASLPRLCGQCVSVESRLPSVIEGFRLAYQTLQKTRESLLKAGSPLWSFRSVKTRRIMRDTRQYSDLLFWSTSPDLLTSGTARDIALDRLYENPLGPPFEEAPIVAQEKRSLWEADIPIFYSRPASRCVRSSTGAQFGPFPVCTPFSLMRQRLAQLCEEDMNWQIELIRGSFGMSFEPANVIATPRPRFPEATEPTADTARDRLLRHAVALGEALERLALRDERGCRWLTLMRHPSFASQVFYGVTDPWLYAGAAGAGLFLANLAAVTHQSRFANLAQGALNYAAWQNRFLMDHPFGDPLPISGYCGQGSLIYAFVEAGRLLNDDRWLARAMELRTAISQRRIEREENPDVVGGLAGLLWALVHLYRAAPAPEILTDMISIGHRLVALQHTGDSAGGWWIPGFDKTLLGIGHGAAGIVNALVRLWGLTGMEPFRQAAQKGILFERLHFSTSHGDWPNLQRPSAGPSFMTGWCAGAPGAGLARLSLMPAWPDDDMLEKEIECAVTATLRHLGTGAHHLCCGESGRILFLLEASSRLHCPSLAARAEEAGLSLAKFYETQGFWLMQSCSERSILPELMGGISGIGLTFLTLVAPEQRSKVLTLE